MEKALDAPSKTLQLVTAASAQNTPMAAEGLLREDHRLNDPSSSEGQAEEKVIRCLKGICFNFSK